MPFRAELVRARVEGGRGRAPTPRDAPLWLTWARAGAGALVHEQGLPPSASGEAGVLNAPACTLSVDSLVQASARLFGHAVDPPQVELDPALCDALAQRPYRVAIETALTLGFEDGLDAEALVRELVAAPDP